MTFTKSLLLGSAAALVAAASAQAADLPSKKAAPAQYVKICDAAGAGYFYIPGSDTCLKISGYVEVDVLTRTTKATNGSAAAARNNNTISTDVEIDLDTVTKTSYGDLGVHIGYEADKGASGSVNPDASAYIDAAYLTFAGLSAGRQETFMNNIGGLYSGYQTPDYKTNSLAYTISAGGGISATVALEDSTSSRGGVSVGTAFSSTNTSSSAYNGERTPDVVGKLQLKQGWGEVDLNAGYHVTPYVASSVNKTATGYAVVGTIKINLPMLAAGDTIAFQSTYERNALKLGGLTNANSTSYNGWQNTPVDVINGQSQTGYTFLSALTHNWTSTVATSVEGSYGHVKYSSKGDSNANGYSVWSIGQVTKWTPVKGLEFGVDTAYTRYTNNDTTNYTTYGKSQSDFRVQGRVIRSF